MLVSVRQQVPEKLKAELRRVRARLLSLRLPSRGNSQQSEAEVEAGASLSVIIPISGASDVIRRCLVSLERYASRAEIILVDDASCTNIADMLKGFEARNGWKVIRHDCPVGHSRATEVGARLATRPILCLLNSDTVITPSSWEGIVNGFVSDNKIGAAGPSTSWAVTDQMTKAAMHCRHYWNDSEICSYANRLKKSRGKQIVDLPEVSGCAFFIRRDIWQDLGGFDPNLPDYGNESELCLRILERGWRIVWVKGSYIHHFGGKTYGSLDEKELFAKFARARQYIDSKHPHTKAVRS